MSKDTISIPVFTREDQKRVHLMQLLGDSTRYKIFKLLLNQEELCVSEIAQRVEVSTSAASQHFKNFEMLGVVAKKRYGQKICYSLVSDASIKFLSEIVQSNEIKEEEI